MSEGPFIQWPSGGRGHDNPELPPHRVTGLGALAVRLLPAGELAFVVDLVGVENRPPSSDANAGPPAETQTRYLFSPGQVAELVVELLSTGKAGGPQMREALLEALEAMR